MHLSDNGELKAVGLAESPSATGICDEEEVGRSFSPRLKTRIVGVGTATPPTSYTQLELLDRFGIKDRRIRSIFANSAIERRYLILPYMSKNGSHPNESQGELLTKHKKYAIDIGAQAVRACISSCNASLSDISFLCCVTTTGFLSPGVSAFLCRELGLDPDRARLDVVGMGCNGGLNALNATASWASANPGKLAIMLCVEICSAAYVIDETVRTGVVNSLFGDGAAAIALRSAAGDNASAGPAILKFNSRLITEAIDAMRYDWDESNSKFSFFLDPQIPYVVGANIEATIHGLLANTGLRRSDIVHWVVHSGGKKVIDAIRINLGLSAHDLRHTISVLRDYGNVSSSSFLFSYQRLMSEGTIAHDDYGVMIAMGPGSTIESALLQW